MSRVSSCPPCRPAVPQFVSRVTPSSVPTTWPPTRAPSRGRADACARVAGGSVAAWHRLDMGPPPLGRCARNVKTREKRELLALSGGEAFGRTPTLHSRRQSSASAPSNTKVPEAPFRCSRIKPTILVELVDWRHPRPRALGRIQGRASGRPTHAGRSSPPGGASRRRDWLRQ